MQMVLMVIVNMTSMMVVIYTYSIVISSMRISTTVMLIMMTETVIKR